MGDDSGDDVRGTVVTFGGSSLFGYDRLIRRGDAFVALKGEDVSTLRIGAKVRLRGDTRGYVPGSFSPNDEVEIVGFVEPFKNGESDHIVKVAKGKQRGFVKPSNIAAIVSAPVETPDQDARDGEPVPVVLARSVPEAGPAQAAHMSVLRQGAQAWNAWRLAHRDETPRLAGQDLRGLELREINFEGADLSGIEGFGIDLYRANLKHANLQRAFLQSAQFIKADLTGADLTGAALPDATLISAVLDRVTGTGMRLGNSDLSGAILTNARLDQADLSQCRLFDTDFRAATLHETNLMATLMIRVDLRGAALVGCRVHGAAVWKIDTDVHTQQSSLIVTDYADPTVTTDNLGVAQLIHLLINVAAIRDVIDTMTGRAVLLLGRFTPERMATLQAIAQRLREFGDLPIIFNFDKPVDRSVSETVRILAGLSKFVIVDLTDPKSAPYESHLTVPDLAVPFLPVIQQGQSEFSMFDDLYDYPWVLEGFAYRDVQHLLDNLERLRGELAKKRTEIESARLGRPKKFRTELPGK